MSTGYQALRDFVTKHAIEGDQNGRHFFRADVEFLSSVNAVEEANAFIGFDAADTNQLSFNDAGDLTAERVHTEFKLAFQHFEFDGERLIVEGNSGKVGDYRVVVVPAR